MTCQTSLQVPIFRDWRWDNCWIKELQERSGTWDVSTTTETKSIPQLLKKDVTRSSRHWHPLNCWIEVKKIQYWNILPCPQQQKLKSWEAASIYHSLQSNWNRNWVEGLKPQEREAPRKKKKGEGENKSWRNSSSNICPSTQVHSQ